MLFAQNVKRHEHFYKMCDRVTLACDSDAWTPFSKTDSPLCSNISYLSYLLYFPTFLWQEGNNFVFSPNSNFILKILLSCILLFCSVLFIETNMYILTYIPFALQLTVNIEHANIQITISYNYKHRHYS